MDKPKISEMVVDFAGDFLRLGKTPDERRNLLRSACSAWNIACAPEATRTKLVDQFLANYRQCNPRSHAEELRTVHHDLELLIQQKLKKYPHIIKQIVSCELTVVNGKDHIAVDY